MRPRYSKLRDQRDGNHVEIVRHLRAHGYEVTETERPVDIFIYRPRDKRGGWAEIKVEGGQIKRSQIAFAAFTKAPIAFIRNEAEALEYARTLTGLSDTQKDALAVLLNQDKATAWRPEKIARVLNNG